MPYYRRNLYILSFTIFLAAASWNLIIPFLPLFLKQMNVKGNLLGWIGIVFAAQSVAAIIAQPFWGKLGDNYGRKAMVIRAGFCLSGIYFAMSMSYAPWHLALCRFFNGALTGFIPGSITLIATNTPEEIAPRSVATAQAASAAGIIIGPAIGGLLAAAVGYRGAMIVSGIVDLIATLLVWWLVQEPNKPVPSKEKTSLLQDFGIALRSPVQLSVLLAVFFAWVYSNAINPYLPLHLGDLGAARWLVGIIFILPAAAFLISAHYWTRLGERIGFERIIQIGFICAGIAVAFLTAAPSLWTFAIIYFLSGLGMAAVQPGTAAITCTRVDESFRGRAYGIQQSAGTLGALVAPLFASRIGSAYGLRSIFLSIGVILLIGGFSFKALALRWRSMRKPGCCNQSDS
jgi:DHA1 family multidrug resistance protein-like MFS transporter